MVDKNEEDRLEQVGLFASGGGSSVASNRLIPVGGSSGQALVKNSGSDFDASWGTIGGFTAALVTPPVSANWTWQNQSTATIADIGNGVQMTVPVGAAGYNKILQALHAAPYDLIAAIVYKAIPESFSGFGLFIRDSVTGNYIIFAYLDNTGGQWYVQQQTSADANFSTRSNIGANNQYGLMWMRIKDDGTNVTYQFSADGYTWVVFYTEAHATYITPNQIGFFGTASTATRTKVARLLSWSLP